MGPSAAVEPGWGARGALRVEARLSALGAPHGVTTRRLGDMKRPELRRAALAAAGVDADPLVLDQVHGAVVVQAASAVPGSVPRADGWLCSRPGVAAGVFVADCLPIFVWDLGGAAAGVFHAGWRGLAAGMPQAAVRAFQGLGLGPDRLGAAVGPHVGACCYRVGPEVAARFPREVQDGGALDLGAEARRQLGLCGIAPERISLSADCTACSPDEFFSYRRDKLDRRMFAFILLPEATHGS